MGRDCKTLGCHFDDLYWGPGGPDISKWGRELARGIQYRQTGAPVKAGTPGQRRQLGGSRKPRHMASDDLKG
jgi:hypothetical protein